MNPTFDLVQHLLQQEHCRKQVALLPFKNRLALETRRLYFALAQDPQSHTFYPEAKLNPLQDLHQQLPTTRILSFGSCNVTCSYCKRDCQFIDPQGQIIKAKAVPTTFLFEVADLAQQEGQTLRLSGGDPAMYPSECLALAKYLKLSYQQSISIAHNGSAPGWVEKMLPYLSSAAIDLKAPAQQLGQVMGISREKGEHYYQQSLKTQNMISHQGITLDVRTPIFGHTTLEDLQTLANDIANNHPQQTFWTWRLYNPVQGCSYTTPDPKAVRQNMKLISKEIPHIWMGLRTKWKTNDHKSIMLFCKEGKALEVVATPQGMHTLSA